MSKINVLLVKPYEKPKVVSVENTLKALQTLVEGPIEVIAPWNDPVVLVCNEEGKIRGRLQNRSLGRIDVIYGTFFLCGISGDAFDSIGSSFVRKYTQYFS